MKVLAQRTKGQCSISKNKPPTLLPELELGQLMCLGPPFFPTSCQQHMNNPPLVGLGLKWKRVLKRKKKKEMKEIIHVLLARGYITVISFQNVFLPKISRNIFGKAIINRMKYLRYKRIGYQQWPHLSLGAFGSSAGGSCTKIFKMKKSL